PTRTNIANIPTSDLRRDSEATGTEGPSAPTSGTLHQQSRRQPDGDVGTLAMLGDDTHPAAALCQWCEERPADGGRGPDKAPWCTACREAEQRAQARLVEPQAS